MTERPRHTLWLCLTLVTVTVIAFWPVGSAGFLNLDDDAYVEYAPMVNRGLHPAAIVWAWTGIHSNNWHPLTSMSHMLDCTLWGLRAAPMHWENLAWHVLNSLLVFFVWRALTGATWRSVAVAGLFALHPLHVESVAWIAERKDVLCLFFWLLALAAYLGWVRQGGTRRYLLTVAAAIGALLSKPMAVTLPLTFLLLDLWPLERLRSVGWRRLIIEKAPFFGLVVLHSGITFAVQFASGAADYAERFPLAARLGNAAVAYARYVGKMFWPQELSPMYWHPGYWPWAAVLGALLFLIGVSVLAWQNRVRRPWLLFGWAWFLLTLVPVIGIIQVGAQSMADRYTYVPLLGLFTIIVWLAHDLVKNRPALRVPVATAACALVFVLSVLTNRQVRVWNNNEALYRHSITHGNDNPAVRYLLAVALRAAGKPESEFAPHWQRAIELESDYVNAHMQLAMLDLAKGKTAAARQRVERMIAIHPRNPSLRFNLAMVYQWEGRKDDCRKALTDYVAAHPKQAGARRQLAQLASERGDNVEALKQYALVVQTDRWSADYLAEYGILLANTGSVADSERQLRRAVWVDPRHKAARDALATVESYLAQQKR